MKIVVSTGLCTNPTCSIAASAQAVERYLGPGEYCPECGELLKPASTETPASNGSRAQPPGRRVLLLVATIVVAAIAAAAMFAALRPVAPARQTAANRAAFNGGAHSRQHVELIENAASCAIVLLRPACSRELDKTGALKVGAIRRRVLAEIPQITTTGGAHGDMRLGAYAMTAAQMLEDPILSTQSRSRAFFRDITLRLAECQPSAADARRAREIARRFLTVASIDDWNALRKQWRDDVFYRAIPKTSRRAFVFGIVAVQIAHLASALRSPNARDDDLSVLETLSEFDSAAGIAEARRATLAARDDWHALNTASTQLVRRIVQ